MSTCQKRKVTSVTVKLVLIFALTISGVFAREPLPVSRVLNCKPIWRNLREGLLALIPQKVPQIQSLKKDLSGLNYDAVIPWTLKEEELLDLKLVRYHRVKNLTPPIPQIDPNQPLGLAKAKLKDLHFSQVTCKNEMDGGYTVVGNAQAFRNGTLSLDVFKDKPLEVWRDVTGKIWSVDHRRLVAMKMAGNIDEVAVKFITPEQKQLEAFKHTNRADGKSIFVLVEPPPGQKQLAIVYMDDELREVANAQRGPSRYKQIVTRGAGTRKIDDYLTGYSKDLSQKWKAARGKDYIKNLIYYADELAEDYNIVRKIEKAKLKDQFDDFGKVSLRGKKFESVLTKLVKKDIKAFEKGKEGIGSIKNAQKAIGDGLGGRIILKANGKVIDQKNVQSFVDHLCSEIRNGLNVTQIDNYRAEANLGIPYLSDAQINQIVEADAAARRAMLINQSKIPPPMIVTNGENAIKNDGYSGFQMNFEYPSGYAVEVQIRGPVFHEVSEVNHLFYDIGKGKPLTARQAKNPELAKLVKLFKDLPESEKVKMNQYMEDNLIHARRIESGMSSPEPTLPPSLPSEFDFNKLKEVLLVH